MLLWEIVLLATVPCCFGYNNGYGMKPFLGWQSWCAVGKCGTDLCTDQQVRDTAKALVDNGMKDLGYEWIVIDDCWHPSRDANGTLVPYADYFPNGIKPVVDYVHSLGLKFGLYTSVGDLTCHKGWSPGSFGHYQEDADLFASWGVDYLKVDWCGGNKSIQGHINISHALNKTGRPMVLELCRGDYEHLDHWGYADSIAQVWRADGDHHDSFEHTLEQLAAIKNKSTWSGPYGWAYMDMMMIGGEGCMPKSGKAPDPKKPSHCPGQSDHEYRTEGATYSVTSSPMMIGTDIRDMTPVMTEVLLNKKLLAINQDYLAPAGFQTTSCGSIVWTRHLSNGTVAVAAPNLGSKDADISICFEDIGWNETSACIYDVWTQAYVGVYNKSIVQKVKSHDNMYVVVEPLANCPPGPPPPPPVPPSPPPPPSPSPSPPGSCTITVTKQLSHHHKCEAGKTYGCAQNKTMWVTGGCAAIFTCDGTPNIDCESKGEKPATCSCAQSGA